MQTSFEVDPLTEFFESIRSPMTKNRYERRLDLFLKWIKADGENLSQRARTFATRAKAEPAWATFQINEYMRFQRGRASAGEISESTLANFWKPIKLFTEQNDILLNWKKITRRIPFGRNYANDRAPTPTEILQVMGYHDPRIKPIILVMVSSGIRVGAWDYLRWGDVRPVEKDGRIVAATLTVYSGTNDEYKTFVTAEAYNHLKKWMDSRIAAGEKVTDRSWLMRDLWEDQPTKKGGVQQRGLATAPKKLTATGVMRLIQRALFVQGLRKKLEPGKRRHEFQADHGFRKFFNTVCDRHMKTLYVEFLMGHNTGLKESYNRAQHDELLAEYLKAAPGLTFFEKIERSTEDVDSLKAALADVQAKLDSTEGKINEAVSNALLKHGISPTMGTGQEGIWATEEGRAALRRAALEQFAREGLLSEKGKRALSKADTKK